MSLTKEEILAAAKRVDVKTIHVPGLGDVCLRPLKGWQRDQLDIWGAKQPDMTHYRARLVALSLCDEGGTSLGFTDADILALSEASAGMLEPLFEECRKLSGIGQQDVKEQEKNSAGQSESSGEN